MIASADFYSTRKVPSLIKLGVGVKQPAAQTNFLYTKSLLSKPSFKINQLLIKWSEPKPIALKNKV